MAELAKVEMSLDLNRLYTNNIIRGRVEGKDFEALNMVSCSCDRLWIQRRAKNMATI